jgi:hypothetical protein
LGLHTNVQSEFRQLGWAFKTFDVSVHLRVQEPQASTLLVMFVWQPAPDWSQSSQPLSQAATMHV